MPTEYSPMDNSYEALMYRKQKRKDYEKSPEGQRVSTNRLVDSAVVKASKLNEEERLNEPDEVHKEYGFLRTKITEIFRKNK